MLGLGLHAWESVMLASLGVAALAAAVVGVSTYAVVQLQKLEAKEASEALEQYKLDAGAKISAADALGKTAQEAAAKAQETTAVLQKEAADARLETERLKKEFGWRNLSSDQLQRISRVLANMPMEITVGWTSGDPESAYFAGYLAQAFQASGSTIAAFAPFGMLGQQQYGLKVSGSESSEVSILVESLEAAFLGPITKELNNKKPDGTKYFTHLFVGFRKPPIVGK